MIRGVPWFEADLVWPEIKPLVEHCFKKAKEHRFDVDDVYQMVKDRTAQLWVAGHPEIDGVLVTQILTYPRATECLIFLACGKLHEDWEQELSSLLVGAPSLGCTHASAYVRPGFTRLLKDWETRQTYMVKELR